jgi:hypothetical protein
MKGATAPRGAAQKRWHDGTRRSSSTVKTHATATRPLMPQLRPTPTSSE